MSGNFDILNIGEHIIWVGPWIPVNNLKKWRAASPAAMKWQRHLLAALREAACDVDFYYYRPDPYWPKGRLAPCLSHRVPFSFHQSSYELKYVNFPGARSLTLSRSMKSSLARAKYLNNDKLPIVISYNAPDWFQVAIRRQRALSDVRWICVVADGVAPPDADGYVFLSYGYYQRFSCTHKLHLDGGVYPPIETPKSNLLHKIQGKKIFLYSGSLGRWGGVELILDALSFLDRSDFELVLTGPTPERRLRQKMENDQRVRYLGLLNESELMGVYALVDFFINPRPTRLKDGDNNFPSKLLDYLWWKKPILSTWTDGLAPEYVERLEVFEDEPKQLAQLMGRMLEDSRQRNTPLADHKDWRTHAQRLRTFALRLK